MKIIDNNIEAYLDLLIQYTAKLEEYYDRLNKNIAFLNKVFFILNSTIIIIFLFYISIGYLTIHSDNSFNFNKINKLSIAIGFIVLFFWFLAFFDYIKIELQLRKHVKKDISWTRAKVLEIVRIVSQYNEHIEKDELIKLKINFRLTDAEHILYKTRKYMQDYHYESIVKKSKEEELEIVEKLEVEKTS